MSSLISYLIGSRRAAGIDLAPVQVHSIETDPDKRARCLKHLLKANHANYSIIYNGLRYDNHNVHILCSAYLLGADEVQLNDIYDSEIRELEPWVPSPAELIDEDWRDSLGDRRFQRAFVDFFEDKLAIDYVYDWRLELRHYLLDGERPLLHGLIGGLGHPLIHLAYAYEMNCKEVAMEALALASCQYNFLHKYLDEASHTRPSPVPSGTPLQLLERLSKDTRFDHLPGDLPLEKLEKVFEENESLILEYWNALHFDEPRKQFELCQQAAVALFVATVRPGTDDAYNFYVVHLLTTSHAVRVLLSFLPAAHHIPLVREWWLLTLAIFVIRGRPVPDKKNLIGDLGGRTWKHVRHRALTSDSARDAHYVKAIRAMKEAAETWGDADERYLRSAVTFADNFRGWSF